MNAFRQLIWDWNGTLLDDTQACVNALNVLLARRNLPRLETPFYRDHFGFPVIDFYRLIQFPLDQEDWDRVALEFHDAYRLDTTKGLHTDALAVLDACKVRGLRQCMLSASEQKLLHAMLAHYGLLDYFDLLAGVDNLHGHSKVERGRSLMKELDCAPDQILLVGDTLHDKEVADALGIACVLVAQGHQSRSRLLASGAVVLDSLSELASALSV